MYSKYSNEKVSYIKNSRSTILYNMTYDIPIGLNSLRSIKKFTLLFGQVLSSIVIIIGNPNNNVNFLILLNEFRPMVIS